MHDAHGDVTMVWKIYERLPLVRWTCVGDGDCNATLPLST